jgi:hypothetical protein
MVGKKAFMKTLEVVIAVVLTMSVLVFAFSRVNLSSDDNLPAVDVLYGLEFNDGFRSCVLSNNLSCVSDFVNNSLPLIYRKSFIINITDDINYIPEGLPDKRVHVDSVIIATNSNPKIVKLFYWVD